MVRSSATIFLLLLLGTLPTPAHAACEGTATPRGVQSIDVAGVKRMFVVRLPSNYDGRTPAPVVFAFHPFGMNAQYMQARVPVPRTWPEAMAVYPEGLPGEARVPAWQGRPGDLGDRDLAFFDAMLAWLNEHACTDARRVFAIGYSNGAQLTGVLACQRGSVLAGVALASGRLTCTPTSGKPVAISHGTQDSTIAYDQAIAASRAWSTVNGCRVPPKVGTPGCFQAESCTGAPVTLCTYIGGHEYNPPFTATAIDLFKGAGR